MAKTKAEIMEWLRERLSDKLYRHSIATRELAAELADIYNVDARKAAMAGLLHDCARGMSSDELLSYADRYRIPLDRIQMTQPVLLHGPVGAKMAQIELGVSDDEILHAIAVHSLGSEGMSVLDKVLYVADSSEPNRDYPEAQRIREMALSGDLDGALLEAMDAKICYVLKQQLMIHPSSIEARNDVLRAIRASFRLPSVSISDGRS